MLALITQMVQCNNHESCVNDNKNTLNRPFLNRWIEKAGPINFLWTVT